MLAVFEFEEEVIEKPLRSKSELKNFRFRGRKANKLIVTPDVVKSIGKKVLRASVVPDGIVICTNGEKIYDGKNKSMYK